MKVGFKIWTLSTLAAVTLSSCDVQQNNETQTQKVSRVFEYSGYSTPEFKGHKKLSIYIPTSDGGKVATDVYLPDGFHGKGTVPSSFPAIVMYSPYRRSSINAETGEVLGDALSEDYIKGKYYPGFFLSHGYAIVFSEMRLTGASTGGEGLDLGSQRMGEDIREVIDWIADQDWSDGNVGMMGRSAPGLAQVQGAGEKPKALKAIMPGVIPMEGFSGAFYPGGIYMQGFQEYAGVPPEVIEAFYASFIQGEATPVVDEDGDGELNDEIPLDLDDSGSFLDDYDISDPEAWPPQYTDDSPREHIHYLTLLDQAKSLEVFSQESDENTVSGNIPYSDKSSDMVISIAESGIPVYNIGGWFGGFNRGTVKWYASLKETNPSKLLMFPSYHGIYRGFIYEKRGIEFPDYQLERLRFFDRYLKGIDNGIENDPPIHIYVMNGDGWRAEYEWPLARQVETPFYFDAGNTLARNHETGGSDSYTADYSHDRQSNSNGDLVSRWLALAHMGSQEEPDMTAKDAQSLLYTTEPIEQDMEITGHPIVSLWVSSTADYGDFYVYLEDVDETGKSVQITEGMLRAGWAKLYDNDLEIKSDKDFKVLPDLPWHGYQKDQWQDGILADGKSLELTFDLLPTSWVFKKGHRVRVAITASNWPDFRLHPKLSPENSPEDKSTIVPVITVHHDSARPSRIVLPVIPGAY